MEMHNILKIPVMVVLIELQDARKKLQDFCALQASKCLKFKDCGAP